MTFSYTCFINNFIDLNYSNLKSLAVDKCKSTKFNPDDLLNELIIYLHENQSKVTKVNNNQSKKTDPLLRFCNDWLYNQTYYPANKYSTNFKGKFQVRTYLQLEDVNEVKYELTETTPEDIDLQDLTLDHREKIIFLRNYYHKLNNFERKLYTYHFIDGLAHYSIAEILRNNGNKVSPSSIYKLLVELRKKLKLAYDNRNLN